MRRLPHALAAALAAAALTVAGCSGSSTSTSPRDELLSGIDKLGSGDSTTTTLQLQADPATLQAYARAQGDKLSARDAGVISSAQLVISTKANGDKHDFALAGKAHGTALVEIRSVGGTLYLRGDVAQLLALAHESSKLGDLRARVDQMPTFVQAFVAGRWVSLNAGALSGLAGQLGGGAGASSSNSKGPVALRDLKAVLSRDVTVTKSGTDSYGDHLVVTGDAQKIATDIRTSVTNDLPGGAVIGGKLDTAKTPHRTVRVDAWVKDGMLTRMSIDLAQFNSKGSAATGTLPLVFSFSSASGDISVPAGATPVDLTQLGTLLGPALGG